MNYKKLYKNLISIAKIRNVNLENFEVHHIKPKCCGGNNDDSNLVKFTFREHYLAHRLLVKIYPNNKFLAKALWMMTITTIASLENIKTQKLDCRLKKRITSILENRKTKITTHEYDFSKNEYVKHMIGHDVSEYTKKLISCNTKIAMLSKDVIDKCASGSKGTRHYYDKKTLKEYKWFPGDPEIDLSKYAFGRPPMSAEQKMKISNTKKLNKTKYHNDELQLTIDIYHDYIKKIPNNWFIGKKEYKNNTLFKQILYKVKIQLLKSNIFFNNIFTYTPKEITRHKKILNPAFFDIFHDMLINWKTNTHIVDDIVDYIQTNQNLIDKKVKEFLKDLSK